MARIGRRTLLLFMSLCSFSSLAMIIVAVLTDYWVYSSEYNLNKNSTLTIAKTGQFEYKHIGLWRTCKMTVPDIGLATKWNCTNIKYFDKSAVSSSVYSEPDDIVYGYIKISCAFPLSAGVVQIFASIICGLSYSSRCCSLKKDTTSVILITGIFYIVAGLLTIIGVIVFVAAISEEYGSRARPKSLYNDPDFKYGYGWSFFFAVASFVLINMAGVFAVYLYMSRSKREIRQELKEYDQDVYRLRYRPVRSKSMTTITRQQSTAALESYQNDTQSAPDLKCLRLSSKVPPPPINNEPGCHINHVGSYSAPGISFQSAHSSSPNYAVIRNAHDRNSGAPRSLPQNNNQRRSRSQNSLPRHYSVETIRKTTPV